MLLSVPPKVNSPFAAAEVEGVYEIPMDSVLTVPWDKRLSVTEGTVGVLDTVPDVRSTGPILFTGVSVDLNTVI